MQAIVRPLQQIKTLQCLRRRYLEKYPDQCRTMDCDGYFIIMGIIKSLKIQTIQVIKG